MQVTSYKNYDSIMTLTLSLSTSHLTADTESEQCGFLRHSLLKLFLTELSTAFMHVFSNKSLASEKLLELHFFVVNVVSLTAHSLTH